MSAFIFQVFNHPSTFSSRTLSNSGSSDFDTSWNCVTNFNHRLKQCRSIGTSFMNWYSPFLLAAESSQTGSSFCSESPTMTSSILVSKVSPLLRPSSTCGFLPF
ncbi:hypothetical protein M758_UG061300 [Ceratodon purpureus]|nr:hypothetical protein M758_UG061300 [Ceratodon purpureus]